MSTKSIFKNVNVKGRSQVLNLVDALENAEKFKEKNVVLSRSELKGSAVKTFFKGTE